MRYCVELIRDINGDVIEQNILSMSETIFPSPRGKECIFVTGAETDDLTLKKCSVDGDGVYFIEDNQIAIDALASENEIQLIMKRQDFGRRLIAIITIRNNSKGLTQLEVVQFASDYATINTALLNGSVGTAKALIEAITPDGTITTQSDKDALIAEINANEARLGY